MYFVPASDHNNTSISSLQKWEQAFRVYSNIFLKEHPETATELVQYNHVISTAATSYISENIYSYDKEFHQHMSVYPNHNWG